MPHTRLEYKITLDRGVVGKNQEYKADDDEIKVEKEDHGALSSQKGPPA